MRLEDIYVHMTPEKDEHLFADYAVFDKAIREQAKKLLAGDLTAALPSNAATEGTSETPDPSQLAPFTHLTPTLAQPYPNYATSQKLCLIAPLLHVGAWEDAFRLLSRLGRADPVTHLPIRVALCDFVRQIIAQSQILQPLHTHDMLPKGKSANAQSSVIPLESIPPFVSRDATLSLLHRSLLCISHHLCHDLILFCHVCRLLVCYLKAQQASEDTAMHDDEPPRGVSVSVTAVDQRITDVLRCALLPAVSRIPANHGVQMELYNVFQLLPPQNRYSLYGQWRDETYELFPELCLIKAHYVSETKRLCRRMTKDNVKEYKYVVGKATHSNPLLVTDTLLDQIKVYSNHIPIVIESTKYLSHFSYDVINFLLLEHLTARTDKWQADLGFESHWLQNLATFAGTFFRKTNLPSADPGPLLLYLFKQFTVSAREINLRAADLLWKSNLFEIFSPPQSPLPV